MSNTNASIMPYLFFGGRCEEAIDFYKSTLGAKVEMLVRFKDNPDKAASEKMEECGALPLGFENKIMHACFSVRGTTLLASDGNGHETKFDGFSLSLSVTTEAEADRVFGALVDGGKVVMPLCKTFYSPRFGMLTDRFGLGWMIIVPADKV